MKKGVVKTRSVFNIYLTKHAYSKNEDDFAWPKFYDKRTKNIKNRVYNKKTPPFLLMISKIHCGILDTSAIIWNVSLGGKQSLADSTHSLKLRSIIL